VHTEASPAAEIKDVNNEDDTAWHSMTAAELANTDPSLSHALVRFEATRECS